MRKWKSASNVDGKKQYQTSKNNLLVDSKPTTISQKKQIILHRYITISSLGTWSTQNNVHQLERIGKCICLTYLWRVLCRVSPNFHGSSFETWPMTWSDGSKERFCLSIFLHVIGSWSLLTCPSWWIANRNSVAFTGLVPNPNQETESTNYSLWRARPNLLYFGDETNWLNKLGQQRKEPRCYLNLRGILSPLMSLSHGKGFWALKVASGISWPLKCIWILLVTDRFWDLNFAMHFDRTIWFCSKIAISLNWTRQVLEFVSKLFEPCYIRMLGLFDQ